MVDVAVGEQHGDGLEPVLTDELLDAAGGLVVDKLRELGLDENTIVIWTTDHGDAIACQGGHFDKDSHMAQEVERIPMAIRWPGSIQPGQTSDRLVFTCDLPATMLDAAGLAFPERVATARVRRTGAPA